MRNGIWASLIGLGVLASLSGCSSKPPAAAESVAKPVEAPNLTALLDKSRKELNEQSDTYLRSMAERNAEHRKGAKFELLDELPEPLVPPVLQKAKFDTELDLSVPAYGEDAKSVKGDEALARHYAAFGDIKGAEALAPSLKGKFGAQALPREYPIEWTRCAALAIADAISRVAKDNRTALQELLGLHRQVQEICKDEKVKNSLVAQTLLPLGRRTVLAATAALKKKNDKKRDPAITKLIDECETAIASWGISPPAVGLDGTKEEWVKKLAIAKPSPGRVLVCDPPDRAMDLLKLPFPREDVTAVLLFFPPGKGDLEEITIVYSTEVLSAQARAADLAGILGNSVEFTREEGDDDERTSVQKWNQVVCKIRLLTADRPVGGWVRISRQPLSTATPPRALGPVKLDWSFDTNRLHIAPHEKIAFTGEGEFIVAKPELIAALSKETLPDGAPLPDAKLAQVALHPVELNKFLMRQVRYRYEGNANLIAMALPYWSQFGASEWRTATVGGGGVEVYWGSDITRLTVSIPQTQQDPELLLADLRDPRDQKETVERVNYTIATENEDRQRRLAAGKPWTRLPRKIAVPALGSVTNYELGITADAANELTPKSDQIIKIAKPEGAKSNLLVIVNASPAGEGTGYIAREWMLRFQQGKDGQQLTWIRVHYEAHAATPRNWPQEILQAWQAPGGIMSLRQYRLGSLLGEEPKPPQFTYWRDDLTEVSLVFDPSGSVEVTLASRPADDPQASPTASTPTYLPRGPYPNIVLGMTSVELQQNGLRNSEKKPNEYLMAPGANDPWDAIQITTDESNRVVSIVARYRPEQGKPRPSQRDIQDALVRQWGRQIRIIGWPNRTTRGPEPSGVLNTFTWLDAVTRYRLTWSPDAGGQPVLLSEWRDVSSLKSPSVAGAPAVTGPGFPTSIPSNGR